MQKQKVLKIIRSLMKDIDFNIISNYINSTKGQLARKNERHFASNLRDQFFQICSSSEVEYIDQNRADLFYKKFNQKIEIKYLTDGFLYSQEKKNPREIINEIKLINTDSKGKIDVEKDCKDTLILCCEPNAFSILLWSDLIKYQLLDYSKPGQIVARKVPRKLFYEIMNYQKFNIVVEKFDLQKRKDEFTNNISKDFLKIYNDNLTQSYNNYKICKPQLEGEIMNLNLIKNGSTKQAYDLILNNTNHDDSITSTLVQKLFKKLRIEKSIKACGKYIYSLRKANKLHIKKQKAKKNNRTYYKCIYYLNKNHKDYLEFERKNRSQKRLSALDDTAYKNSESKVQIKMVPTAVVVDKVLRSEKLSTEEKNKIIYEIL